MLPEDINALKQGFLTIRISKVKNLLRSLPALDLPKFDEFHSWVSMSIWIWNYLSSSSPELSCRCDACANYASLCTSKVLSCCKVTDCMIPNIVGIVIAMWVETDTWLDTLTDIAIKRWQFLCYSQPYLIGIGPQHDAFHLSSPRIVKPVVDVTLVRFKDGTWLF